MKLGYLIANETGVSKNSVLLLRHSKKDIADLIKLFDGSIEQYSMIQPSETRYDFLATGKPAIQVVVVIVNDKVDAIYRIDGVAKLGTTRTLLSKPNRKFEELRSRPERPAKEFSYTLLRSSETLSKSIYGWTNFRCAVARFGNQLFETVEIN